MYWSLVYETQCCFNIFTGIKHERDVAEFENEALKKKISSEQLKRNFVCSKCSCESSEPQEEIKSRNMKRSSEVSPFKNQNKKFKPGKENSPESVINKKDSDKGKDMKILAPETQFFTEPKPDKMFHKTSVPETIAMDALYEDKDFFDESLINNDNLSSPIEDRLSISLPINTPETSSPSRFENSVCISDVASPVLGKKNVRTPLKNLPVPKFDLDNDSSLIESTSITTSKRNLLIKQDNKSSSSNSHTNTVKQVVRFSKPSVDKMEEEIKEKSASEKTALESSKKSDKNENILLKDNEKKDIKFLSSLNLSSKLDKNKLRKTKSSVISKNENAPAVFETKYNVVVEPPGPKVKKYFKQTKITSQLMKRGKKIF